MLNYHVNVTTQDDSHALAEARGHELTLNVKKGSGEAGFNAAETLLTALGACILTNVNAIGEKMRLNVESARIEFDATRRDEPPALTEIRYKLILKSPESAEKLEELHQLCLKWGTVSNTVVNGIVPQGTLEIEMRNAHAKRGQRNMLVILAHPDDESFPMGGTLAKYAAEGVNITLICATLGELGIPDKPPEEAAAIREKELRAAAKCLGISKVQCMRYQDGMLASVDRKKFTSSLIHAMQRISPQIVITFGPDGISGHPDHVTISTLVTQAFDSAALFGARLYYLAPSDATLQGCGVTPSQEIAGGPVASIDITDYRPSKWHAMQAHASQNPPFQGKPEEQIENLACHEYFTLAHPSGKFANTEDLFAPLKELA